MSSNDPQAPTLQGFLDNMQKSVQAKSIPELITATSSNTLRTAHLAYTLLRQRNLEYADGRRLTVADNIGHVIGLGLVAAGLYASGSEIARRKAGAQTPESAKNAKPIDSTYVVGATTAIGLSVAQVKNGRTLIKKRQLSTYGRVYQTLGAIAGVAQLAVHLHGARK